MGVNKRFSTIYQFKCMVNGKIFFDIFKYSMDKTLRYLELCAMDFYYDGLLFDDIRLYGISSFRIEVMKNVLDIYAKEELDRYIRRYRSYGDRGYNDKDGYFDIFSNQSASKLSHLSKRERLNIRNRKIGIKRLGKRNSKELIDKVIRTTSGRSHDDIVAEKKRKVLSGQKRDEFFKQRVSNSLRIRGTDYSRKFNEEKFRLTIELRNKGLSYKEIMKYGIPYDSITSYIRRGKDLGLLDLKFFRGVAVKRNRVTKYDMLYGDKNDE